MMSSLAGMLTYLASLAAMGGPPDLDREIALIEGATAGATFDEVRSQLKTLRVGVDDVDDRTWARLIGVVDQVRYPNDVRHLVLIQALGAADAARARDILARAVQWADCAEAAWLEHDPTLRVEPYLVNEAYRRAAKEPWRTWIGGDERLLAILGKILNGTLPVSTEMWASVGPVGPAEVLLASPANAGAKSRIVEAYVASAKGRPYQGGPLLALLTPDARDRLLELVRGSDDDPRALHLGASGALAHLGDQRVIAVLRAKQKAYAAGPPVFIERSKKEMGAFTSEIIDTLVARAEWQEPTTRLLTVIRCPPGVPEGPNAVNERIWAIGRAVEVGLPRAEVRRAVLQAAEVVAHDAGAAAHGIGQFGLQRLKEAGLGYGVLNETDLPEVILPDRSLPEPKPAS